MIYGYVQSFITQCKALLFEKGTVYCIGKNRFEETKFAPIIQYLFAVIVTSHNVQKLDSKLFTH